MKTVTQLLLFFCLIFTANILIAEEASKEASSTQSAPKKSTEKKSPRSLLGVDPYDVNGKGIDPLDIVGEESDDPGLDPLDINGDRVLDPYDLGGTGTDPYDSAGDKRNNQGPGKKEKWVPPKIYQDMQQAWRTWKNKPDEPKPPVTLQQFGSELGAGYVGAFGGSVVGLFGGFIVGSIYGELAGCSRCWLNVAAGGSALGAGLLSSAGVYMFGNSETQLGSMPATIAGSMVPILLAESLSSQSKQARKGGFYLLTMPLFATLGYNMSRHYRKPGEKPWFENIFVDDTWVSADPFSKTLAFNFEKRF